ncbi:RING finger protein 37 isoform X1 [Alosa sapidissima]|uniref:RING finger protein 37 isoform X1 n=1 Tax=Alosa sapidissima TaxID=34773 RepID=UPI001C083300|nr:RING finger protein 37 isoform X1 [Alosa sapidissima]
MVVNLCQPPFQTTVQCNKLCADGFDISNLVSEDPALRRRGFKLEYFLRPPVQVTLGFRWQVEVCGVDVELWPCGMDQNGASRRLEVHSSSDANADATQGHFLQVGRCDVRDGVLVCFRAPRLRPRAPFPHLPPPPSGEATQSDLWSRGPQSLGSVARLRLTIPFSSAGSQLGFKALSVWGLPARSSPPDALEEFQRAYRHSLAPAKPLTPPRPPAPASTNTSEPATYSDPDEAVPEEFLDPLTQELMVLPMVLPSGAVVDLSSLEEYQRREATWGRSPSDPFTGVPFTSDSKPLPCPLLKCRIDQMVLRRGGRPGVCGSKERATTLGPQASRLIPQTSKQPQMPMLPNSSLTSHTQPGCTASNGAVDCHTSSSSDGPPSNQALGEGVTPAAAGGWERPVLRRKRGLDASNPDMDRLRDCAVASKSASKKAENSLQPCKKTRAEQQTHSTGSHEERLSASLDAALSCALQGLPSYTSKKNPQGHTPAPHTGEDQCALCSVSLTRYPTSPAAYALPCRHLLCRPCLTRKAPPNAGGPQIVCPTCGSVAAASAVTRVHH